MNRVGMPPGNEPAPVDPGTPIKKLGAKREREVIERGFLTGVSGAIIALTLAFLIGSALTAYNYRSKAYELQEELTMLKNQFKERATHGMEAAKDAAGRAYHAAEEAVGHAAGRASEAASGAADAAEAMREKAGGAAETVKERMPAPGSTWDTLDQAMERIRNSFGSVMRRSRPIAQQTHPTEGGELRPAFPDLPSMLQDVHASVWDLFKTLPQLTEAVGEWEPQARLREEGDAWVVDVDAPAGSKPSFTVDVVGSHVVVAAEEAEDRGEGERSTHRHRHFVQSFGIPGLQRVDPAAIKAAPAAGGAGLRVRIPKSPAALQGGAYRVPIAA